MDTTYTLRMTNEGNKAGLVECLRKSRNNISVVRPRGVI